ncbi:DinB family protein [Paenibacillus sp. P25]|nr:DinB family protein [Paenibacillus sp. P25]
MAFDSERGILQPLGLEYEAPAEGAEPPASVAAITQAYRQAVRSLLDEVQTRWNDEKLQETSTLWGEQLKNGFVLYLLLKHEIHHRGQLTILMRQAGVPLVGIYGPTKEEWISMGTEAPV